MDDHHKSSSVVNFLPNSLLLPTPPLLLVQSYWWLSVLRRKWWFIWGKWAKLWLLRSAVCENDPEGKSAMEKGGVSWENLCNSLPSIIMSTLSGVQGWGRTSLGGSSLGSGIYPFISKWNMYFPHSPFPIDIHDYLPGREKAFLLFK